MPDSERAEALFRQAARARDDRDYPTAEKLQRQGLALWGEEDTRFSLELENLAGIHFIQEKFDRAASEFERALKVREGLGQQDDPSVLRVLYWLAKSYFNHQKYDLAEVVMRQRLGLAEARYDSLETLARSLYELGFLLYFVGRYQEAEPYLLKALPLFESSKGSSDSETVEVLERIALNYANCPAIGQDPEPYFKRAVESIRPGGATSQTYLANLCRWAGYASEHQRFEEADVLFSQLLALIDESEMPNDIDNHWIISDCVDYFQSRDKADLVANLARMDQEFNAYGQMLKRQLEHAERTLPDNDPAFAEAVFGSANYAIFESKYEEAEALLDRSLQAYTQIEGERGETVVQVLGRICVVSRLLKKFEQGEAAIQRAYGTARELYVNRYVLPSTLENFAALREAEGKIADATDLYERAIMEYERVCGFPSHDAVEALYRQSGYLLRIRDLSLAEAKIRRAMSVMDGIESLSKYKKSDYAATLATILEARGSEEESVEMRRLADALYQSAEKESERRREGS